MTNSPSLFGDKKIDIESLFDPILLEQQGGECREVEQREATPVNETNIDLLRTLGDPDPAVRMKTVRTLAERRGIAGITVLSRFLNDPNEMVARAAADALVEADTHSLYALERLFFNSESPVRFTREAKQKATLVIGRIPGFKSEMLLRRLLDNDEVGDDAARYLLARLQCDPCILLQSKKEHWRLRKAVAEYLGTAKDQNSLFVLYMEQKDAGNPVTLRSACLRSISKRNIKHNLEPFLSILSDAGNPVELRSLAALALGKTRNKFVEETLWNFAKDRNTPEKLRFACLRAFIHMYMNAIDNIIPNLILMNSGSNPESIQCLCIKALALIGNDQATASIILSLESSCAPARIAAAYSLGKLKAVQAVRPLAARLYDDENHVCHEVSRVGGQLIDEWLGVVYPVREAAIKALREIGTTEALEYLAAFKDQSIQSINC